MTELTPISAAVRRAPVGSCSSLAQKAWLSPEKTNTLPPLKRSQMASNRARAAG